RPQGRALGARGLGFRRRGLRRHGALPSTSGSSRYVERSPPAKNPSVAAREVAWSAESPEIECPEVHPSAQRGPKPTRKPPTTISRRPRTLASPSHENSSRGASPEKSRTPSATRSARVSGEIAI